MEKGLKLGMEFYGVIGGKLSHSLSPKINNEFYRLLNIEAAYKIFEISREDIKDAGKALKMLSISGANVTIPYKQEVMKFLDDISPIATRIGAVNTIVNRDGKLYGYNSDYYGIGMMLNNHGIEINNKVVALLGTGGSAKACVEYLSDNNVKELYLVSRDKSKVKGFNSKVHIIDYEDLKDLKGDVLFNSTPVGMYPKVGYSPVGENIINNFGALVDFIYNPRETEFLRLGNKLGKKTCNGLYMLVGQAMKSQEFWRDIQVPKEIVDKIYEKIKMEFEGDSI